VSEAPSLRDLSAERSMIPRQPVPTPVACPGAGRCAWHTQGEETEERTNAQTETHHPGRPAGVRAGAIRAVRPADDDSGAVSLPNPTREDNSYSVVTGATGATLDGVTITGGYANDNSGSPYRNLAAGLVTGRWRSGV
jgi:hypothetical protein